MADDIINIDTSGLLLNEEERTPASVLGSTDAITIDASGIEAQVPDVLRQKYRQRPTIPDVESKVINFSERTGLPEATVRNRLPDAERIATEPDWDALNSDNPELAQQLVNDDQLFRLAHDDISNLNALGKALAWGRSLAPVRPEVVERGFDFMGAGVYRPAGALYRFGAGATDVLLGPYSRTAARAKLLPQDIVGEITEALKVQGDILSTEAERLMGDTQDFTPTERGFASGLSSLPVSATSAGAVGLGAKLLPTLITTFGIPTFQDAYEEGRGKGLGVFESIVYGVEQGLSEVGTEFFPESKLLGGLKAGESLPSLLGKMFWNENVGEQINTVLSDFSDWMHLNPGKTATEFVLERPERAYETAIATLVTVGPTVVAGRVASQASGLYGSERQQAVDAKAWANRISEIAEIAKESKLRERAPNKFVEQVERMVKNTGGDTLYINAHDFTEYFQEQGIDPLEVASNLSGVASQLPEALVKNGDVEIRASEYVLHLATSEQAAGLAELIRPEPHAMSAREAAEWEKNENARFEELVKEIEKEHEADSAWQQSKDQVNAALSEQIVQTGRFDKATADKYATVHGTFFEHLAHRMGVQPHEAAQRYGLQVASTPIVQEGGQEFDQDGNLKTGTPAFREFIGSSVITTPVFHGTSDDVDTFDLNHPNRKDTGWLGDGVYMTDSSALASSYANLKAGNADPNIIPLYVRIENPYMATLEEKQRLRGASREQAREFTHQLQEQGYDGVILDYGDVREIVAFDPTQVKSAVGNRGTFDRNDPNILFQGEAQRNSIGLYSAVEKAVLEMNLPAFKPSKKNPDGRASGADIWAKLSKTAGVKREELDWLGIEEFLHSGEKYTRDEVATFVRNNGVEIEEVVAEDEKRGESLSWDDGEIWDDPEAYQHHVEDMLYDFDNGDSDGLFGDMDDFMETWVLSHTDELLANYEPSLPDDQFQELSDAVAEYTSKPFPNTADFNNAVEVLDRLELDYRQDLRQEAWEDFKEEALEVAYGQYMEDPIYIYSAEDADLYIFGNDDIGYSIRLDNWRSHENQIRGQGEIYSLNEAQIQAEEYARENDLIVGGNSPTVARWEDYVMEGNYSNYREIKLTLPGISPEFYNDVHFPDPNIVAFLRVEDRELVVDPEKKEKIPGSALPETGEYQYSHVRDTSYHIDEFQSDWHQQGRRDGYGDQLPDPDLLQRVQESRTSLIRLLSDNGTGSNDTMMFVNKVAAAEHEIALVELVQATFVEGEFKYQVMRLALEYSALENERKRQIESARYAVPDAPFKGDAWMALGLKRAIVDAVENNYDALSWSDAEVLKNRWSDRYSELYENQYNKKMPSIAKKLTGVEPVHLSLEGTPHEHQELGYWIIPITEELKQKVQTEGFSLFQEKRGSIRFPDKLTDEASLIALFETADLSTFLHETGHFFFEVYRDLVNTEGTPQEIHDDMQTLLDFVGVENLAAWNAMSTEQRREGHEKVARAFEAYLFKGNAPSHRLEKLFQTFREWLISVYRSIKALNVELTPEVEQVFDRMLASEEEIRAVETVRRYQPLFESIEQAGMTIDEWADYQALGQQASSDADNELSRRSLRDMRWLTGARARELKRLQKEAEAKRAEARRDAAEQIYSQPLYAAWRFLTHGDREPIGTNQAARRIAQAYASDSPKLSKDALRGMYGDEPLAPWRQLPTGKRGLMAQQGIHPQEVADLFGLASGYQLVEQLLTATPPEQAIEELTDRITMARHGDITNPRVLEVAADQAVHNLARMRFMATELKALDEMMNVRGDTGRRDARGRKISYNVLERAARDFAAKSIARKTVREAPRTAQYSAAEIRAGKAAVAAMRKGDTEEAATHQRARLLNAHFFREATKAGDEIEKILRSLRRFENKGTRKSLSPDHLEQIDALLERYDLRKSVSRKDIEKRTALKDWLESQREQGFNPVIPKKLEDEANRQHYSTLTLEEFRGLRDAVKSIEHVGRLKQKLLTAKDQREFDALMDALSESIAENGGKPKKARIETELPQDRKKDLVASIFAAHRKLADIARDLDGFEDNGLMWQLFIRPLNDATNRETEMTHETTAVLMELFTELHEGGRLFRLEHVPGVGEISRMGRIMVALNLGNDTNRSRIAEGNGWGPEQIHAITDPLTQADWDFVQAIWDHIGSYWAAVEAKEKRVNGVAPKQVEAAPVETKYGTYRGGYFPIVTDKELSPRSYADAMAEQAKLAMQGAYTAATTRRSHTKLRAEQGTGDPLAYNFSVITRHLEQVIHDLAMHEYLIDANRILRDRRVVDAIYKYHGPKTHHALKDGITAVAAGDIPAANGVESALQWVRNGSSIAAMGWNLFTTALQPLGLTQSIARIGAKHVGRGIRLWVSGADGIEGTVEWVHSKSGMMKRRADTFHREINDIRNRLYRETWFKEAMDHAARVVGREQAPDVASTYFWIIAKGQMIADMPTWLGQYEKSMADPNTDEDTAIALADQAVLDSQGGGQMKDLAAVQRGAPFFKTLTNFYGYFNVTFNRQVEAIKKNVRKGAYGQMLFDTAMVMVIPSILSTLLYEALRSPCDGDPECIAKKMAQDQLGYIMGTMIGLRELQSTFTEFDYRGPTGMRVFSELDKLGEQTMQGELDAAWFRAANNSAGILLHYPASQVQRTAEGLMAISRGDTANPLAAGFGAPRN